LFSSAGARLKNENKPATAEKEKTMKLVKHGRDGHNEE